MDARQRTVLRVELITCVGAAVIGIAFQFGDSTLRGMSIFLFGWSLGCVLHLSQLALMRTRRGRRARR